MQESLAQISPDEVELLGLKLGHKKLVISAVAKLSGAPIVSPPISVAVSSGTHRSVAPPAYEEAISMHDAPWVLQVMRLSAALNRVSVHRGAVLQARGMQQCANPGDCDDSTTQAGQAMGGRGRGDQMLPDPHRHTAAAAGALCRIAEDGLWCVLLVCCACWW